ncbi:MAG: NAD-dependent deacylase, partial [Cyclobacteriaceae bacterium]|nr:NAD-dependent deacylase [Cyclobacteriaceae bacterium]
SGVPTFRDADGLWEGHDIMEVATPQGWERNPELVLEFYNQRRKKALEVTPNKGHLILAELEQDFEVAIVTQNVDNLHERAGSSKVLHLHGELFKCRSTLDENLIYPVESWELNLGDCCEKGAQLRPHIVWFGEMVPMMELAVQETMTADIFIVVGTSMVVYPAAGLIDYVAADIPKFIIDPKMPEITPRENLFLIEEVGSKGLSDVKERLKENYL